MRRYLFLFVIVLLTTTTWAADKPASALMVGGNFSSNVSNAQVAVFDSAARNAEVAALNRRLKEKDFSGTINRINELVSKNRVDKRYYLLLAIAYDGLGQDRNVIYSAGQAIAVAPQDPRAYILRAQSYLREGDTERCRIDIEKALSLNPNSPLALKVKQELETKTQTRLVNKNPTQDYKSPSTPIWRINSYCSFTSTSLRL